MNRSRATLFRLPGPPGLALYLAVAALGTGFPAARAADYFVSPEGDDAHPGTKAEPFSTLERAAASLEPGDTCFLRAGRYQVAWMIEGLKGLPSERHVRKNPEWVTVAASPGEEVVLDGTEPLSVIGPWETYRGSIHRARVDRDIWQLFVDDRMVMPARWPNAQLADGTVWDLDRFAVPDNDRKATGRVRDERLAALDVDLTGATLIQHNRRFARVTGHGRGNAVLELSDPVGKGKWDLYYLEGLACLDAPNEWWYDRATQTVYLWLPDGGRPEDHDIRGRTRDYALRLEACDSVRLQGLTFFGTTFYIHNSVNMEAENCRLVYPSCNKRMLGAGYVDWDPQLGIHLFAQPTAIVSDKTEDFSDPGEPTRNAIRNCVIEYADGSALLMYGKQDVIENCHIHDIDWSGLNKFGVCLKFGTGGTFRRNTVHTGHPYALICPGTDYNIELNDVHHGSQITFESTLIHAMIPNQTDTTIHHNWTHDSWAGIRFDTPNNGQQGRDGIIHRNVMWNATRIMVKGDYQKVAHNTLFDNDEHANDLILMNTPWGDNLHSATWGNAADQLSGQRAEFHVSDAPVPGLVWDNWNGASFQPPRRVRDQLRDPDNRDFRPRPGTVLAEGGLGAYAADAAEYWIPGRQLQHASAPVPRDGGTEVPLDADLMWLAGQGAVKHHVYLAANQDQLAAAGPGDDAQRGEFTGGNVCRPGPLEPGRSYYWRVDAVLTGGKTVPGPVWRFQTRSEPEG